MPLDRAGFFSYITFSWVGRYMRKAYKDGLKAEDIPLCSTTDGCDHCAQRCSYIYYLIIYSGFSRKIICCVRVEFMWNEEVQRKGLANASLRRVAWRFTRTRILTSIFLYLSSLVFGFVGPVSIFIFPKMVGYTYSELNFYRFT